MGKRSGEEYAELNIDITQDGTNPPEVQRQNVNEVGTLGTPVRDSAGVYRIPLGNVGSKITFQHSSVVEGADGAMGVAVGISGTDIQIKSWKLSDGTAGDIKLQFPQMINIQTQVR